MSKENTSFEIFPNEIIFYIFEFLTTCDLVKAFVQLNYRYRDVVRYYIKHIDLTDDWEIDRSELQQTCKIIEIVKVDRYHLHLFRNYQFPQLHSLILINVADWEKLLHHMTIKNLKIWFSNDDIEKTRCFQSSKSLPLTLRRFSSNGSFDPICFHDNLTHLNIYVNRIINLLEILGRTPNVKHLSVHFNANFNYSHQQPKNKIDHFEVMSTTFQRLTKLNSIYFTTMNVSRVYKSNQCFPFHQLQLFIDRCCPNKMILKKVTLQLLHISFNENIWSTIQHFKNTFDSFNFYISFIIEDNLKQIKDKVLSENEFAFHIEDGIYDGFIRINSFIHIYSLPLIFNKLYGFTCFSKLNQQCSYSTVRYLYYTENYHNRIISFQSLEKRMPNLLTIDCGPAHHHNCAYNTLNSYNDVLYNVHTLYYNVTCFNSRCIYYNQFLPTVGRMPNLKVLTASYQTFRQINHPLIFLRKLHLHNCQHISVDELATIAPNLSVLMLTGLTSNSHELSSWIRSLFVRFSQLMVLSLQIPHHRGRNDRPDAKLAKQILTEVQSMDSKFQYLKLTFDDIRMEFSFLSF